MFLIFLRCDLIERAAIMPLTCLVALRWIEAVERRGMDKKGTAGSVVRLTSRRGWVWRLS